MKSDPREPPPPPPPLLENENKLPLVEPRAEDPELDDEPWPLVEVDPDRPLLDDRSLNRFVLPRIAPKLDAPVPIAAFAAELVEPVAETSEPPEPPDDADDVVALIEAAEDEELEEVPPELPELDTIADPPPLRRLDPPVPRPERLPLN